MDNNKWSCLICVKVKSTAFIVMSHDTFVVKNLVVVLVFFFFFLNTTNFFWERKILQNDVLYSILFHINLIN